MQVWQPWRKISTEWPQVLLSESKIFCKIKRSFRDFFTRKCSTGSVECSLNNPVAGFPARRPILFGSDLHIHFKKQILKENFCPNLPLDTKIWSDHKREKLISPKPIKKLLNQFHEKKIFSPETFFFVIEKGKWQTSSRKNTPSVQKCSSQCLEKTVRLIFFENKRFFAKIASCLVERSFSNPVAAFPTNDDVFNKNIFLSNYKFPPKSFSEHVRCNFVNRGEKNFAKSSNLVEFLDQ